MTTTEPKLFIFQFECRDYGNRIHYYSGVGQDEQEAWKDAKKTHQTLSPGDQIDQYILYWDRILSKSPVGERYMVWYRARKALKAKLEALRPYVYGREYHDASRVAREHGINRDDFAQWWITANLPSIPLR